VQLGQLKEKYPDADLAAVDQHLRQIHEDVRQSIYNLKTSSSAPSLVWRERLCHWVERFELDTGIQVAQKIDLDESHLAPREKVKLFACIQEAFTNIRKHAKASRVLLELTPLKRGWRLKIEDNGIGFQGDPFAAPTCFGLKIMKERAHHMNAKFSLTRENGKTIVTIQKEL
jgi:two-component system nitrate/nitrite sensor histidine kinase NarQ